MRLAWLAILLVPGVAAIPGPDVEPTPPEPADVFLPQLEGCLWSGSYKLWLETPVARVWKYSCDPET